MRDFLDICYSENHDQYLDLHLPECDSFPVFLYFHGGGLESGDKSTFPELFQELTSRGIAVASANYRMYPDACYPDFLEDAAESVAWIYNNIGNYGRIEGIYVGGSSAGGYLSMMLCFDSRWLGKYGISPLQINGYIHDAGQPSCHFNVLRERGIDTRRVMIDDSAPRFHVGADEKYSPMLIIVSDQDMRNRLEQTTLLISTLSHFGHEAPEVQLKVMCGKHCAYIRKKDEDGRGVFGQLIAQFIEGQT